MRKGLIVCGVAAALLGGGPALASNACYKIVSNDPGIESPSRIRLELAPLGRLTTPGERRMRTFAAHGLFITETPAGTGIVSALNGTATVAYGNEGGVRFSLSSAVLLNSAEPSVINTFMFLDCASDEASPTPNNAVCGNFVVVEEGKFVEQFDIARVNPRRDPRCSAFAPPVE